MGSIFDNWEKKVPPAAMPTMAQPERSGANNGGGEEKPKLHLKEEPPEKSPPTTPSPSNLSAASESDSGAWPPKVKNTGDHQAARPAAKQGRKRAAGTRPATKKTPAKKAASKSRARGGSPEGKRRRRKKPESTPEQKADEAHVLGRLLERVRAAKKEKFQQLEFKVEDDQLIVEIGVNGKVDETTSEIIRKNLRRVIGKEGLELDGTIYSTNDVTIRFFEGFHQPEFDAEARLDTAAEEGTELHRKLAELSELLGTPEDERLIWANVEMLDDGEETFVNVDDRTITPEDDDGKQIIALVTEILKLESRLKLSAVNQNDAGEKAALVQKPDGDFVIRTSQALTTTAEHEEERLKRGEFRREVREASLGNIRRHVDQLFDALKDDNFAKEEPAVQEMAKLFVSKAEEYSAKSRTERQSDNRIRDLLTAAIGTSGSEAEKQVRQIYDVITKPGMRVGALSENGRKLNINRAMLTVHLRTYLRYREIHDQWSQKYGDKAEKRPARVATLPAFHKEMQRFEREDAAYVEGGTIPDPPPQMPNNMNLVVAMASRLGLKHGDWKVPKLESSQPPETAEAEAPASEVTEAQKLLEQKVNAYSLLVENFEMHLAAMLDQEGPFSEAQKDILETIVNSAPILIVPEKIEDELGLPVGSSEELADLDMRLQDLATRSEQLLETDPRMNSMQSYSELLRELSKRADEVAEAEKGLSEAADELQQVTDERDALSVERNTAVARNVYNERQQEDDNEEVARVLHDLMQTGKNQEITIKNRDARINHLEGRESDLEARVRELEPLEAKLRLAELEIQTLKEQQNAGAANAEVANQENATHDSHRQEEIETDAMYFQKAREELDDALKKITTISNERDDYRQRLESLLNALGDVKPEEIPDILADNKSFQKVFPNVITVLESPRADELLPELAELIREVLASSK